MMLFSMISGQFYRVIQQSRENQATCPARHPEGRFHHDGQPALYLSSRPDWAAHAIARYVQEDDYERVIVELTLAPAKILDLRNAEHCAAWGIEARLAAVPWLPERAENAPASSWRVSDRARETGADGMIYTARSAPERWHLVLFKWNGAHPNVTPTGRVLAYPPSGM